MNKKPHILVASILALWMALCLPGDARAEGIIYGDTVAAGITLEQDAILIGQEVVIDGDIEGNVFILGNQVIVNGSVDGSMIVIGQNVLIRGEVSGTVYSAALTLELGEGSLLERDLYVLTVSLTSGKGALIERDLYAIGLDAGLNGGVERNLHTTIGPIQLYNGFMTLIGFPDLTIRLHFDTPQVEGSLPTVRGHARLLIITAENGFDWAEWGWKLLRLWAALIIFTLLTYWLARKWLAQAAEPLRQSPWKALVVGLIVLVISVALFGVAALAAVVVFAIGLGLNFLGLWQITIMLYMACFAVLTMAVTALWFFVAFGAKIIAIYTLSTWAFGRLFQRKAIWMDLLALLAGTVVFALLRTIPYAGWIFDLSASAFGAGAAWLAIQNCRRNAPAVPPPDEPAVLEKPKKAAPKKQP